MFLLREKSVNTHHAHGCVTLEGLLGDDGEAENLDSRQLLLLFVLALYLDLRLIFVTELLMKVDLLRALLTE